MVTVRFRPAVHGIMLGGGDGAEIFGIVALQAADKGGAQLGGEERILAIGFLAAAQRGSRKMLMLGDQKSRP